MQLKATERALWFWIITRAQ